MFGTVMSKWALCSSSIASETENAKLQKQVLISSIDTRSFWSKLIKLTGCMCCSYRCHVYASFHVQDYVEPEELCTPDVMIYQQKQWNKLMGRSLQHGTNQKTCLHKLQLHSLSAW